MEKKILALFVLSLMLVGFTEPVVRTRANPIQEQPDVERFRESWRVLAPITRRNLSVYPVVSSVKANASEFLTLDEGLASGAVRVAERGQVESVLYRRRDSRRWPPLDERLPETGGASVNELVLVNDSSRPLILLAGEVVSGGKQTRIIGADLVVPPKSEPLPLTVFCVEHGRWSEGVSFGAARTIAAPSIRKEAEVNKSQQGVWNRVAASAGALGVASPTSSYQDVVTSAEAKRAFDQVASSIEADYERELRDELRGGNAVGVVVAINGQLVWSDVFSSSELFQKYWPKLLRSYVMEGEGRGRDVKGAPSAKDAAAFLLEDRGRVSIRVEPAAYRRTEISARDFEIVAIEVLSKWGDSGLLIHYNKMGRG